MATTITSLSARLSNRLSDVVSNGASDGVQYTASQRLEALESAVNRLVISLLALSQYRKSVIDILGELSIRTSPFMVNANGYAVSQLTYPIAANGLYAAAAKIGTGFVYGRRQMLEYLDYADNPYFKGSSRQPLYRLEGGTLYWEVDLADYPIETRLHYIRSPKSLSYTTSGVDTTSTFELAGELVEPVLIGAQSEAARMLSDQNRVTINEKLFSNLATEVAMIRKEED